MKHITFTSVRSLASMRLLATMLASLFVCLHLSAQEPDKKEVPFKKFGVGIGYGYRSFMITEFQPLNDLCVDLHPVEISFQYHISQKHTVYLTIPWMVKNQSKINDAYHHYTLEKSIPSCQYDHQKSYTYGFDIGYDYTIIGYKNLSLFAGIGIGIQRYKSEATHDASEANVAPPLLQDKLISNIKTDAYSLLPQAGLKYDWKCIGLELKYRFYITKKKSSFVSEYYPVVPGPPANGDYTNNNTVYKNGISGSFFFYF